MRSIFGKIPFSLLFVFFLSCKTAPNVPDPALMTAVPLESGASVYVFADVKESESILEMFPIAELKDRQTKQMLERTSFFAAALFPPESGRRFQLAAWGSYPGSFARVAFGANKSWVKQSSQSGPYWYSAGDRLSIAVNSKQAFAASWLNDTPGSPVTDPPGIEYPEGFGEFRQGAPLSCWVEDPGPGINRILDNREIPFQIPAQRLFINLFPDEEANGSKQYHAVIRMQFSAAAQARSITSLFTLARNFLDPTSALAQIFFANPPVQDDRNMDIKTSLLTEGELSLLFNMFLLY